MKLKIMGKKRGMMQLFDEKGNVVVCTVIEADPNVVVQVKNKATDGYDAVQLGFEKIKGKTQYTIDRRAGKPQLGHFNKAGVEPRRFLSETKLLSSEEYVVGQEIGVGLFSDVEFVDVIGNSKGKGYQGVMKRHNFSGGPASHGSGFHRHAGSTGMRSTPGRGLPGGKKAGQMGNERVTVQNLKVVRVDKENNVIIVKGHVPGPRNGLVYVAQAIKKSKRSK
jgi:large subunit ribosomal protein L3